MAALVAGLPGAVEGRYCAGTGRTAVRDLAFVAARRGNSSQLILHTFYQGNREIEHISST
jgi:hypothetical protein